MGRILHRLAQFGQTRETFLCGRCGELFFAVGFDVVHESTLDGVACGGTGGLP
jgi:hypothetical protein